MTELSIQKNNSRSDNKLWWKPVLNLQHELNENFKEMTSKLNPAIAEFWKHEDKFLKQLQKDTHKLFSEMFNNRQMITPWLTGTLTEPYINIIENGSKYKIQADVPGLSAKELEISAEDNSITVKGSHREGKTEENDSYIRRECHCGAFSRTIALPDDADIGHAKASFEQNVLNIEIPKKGEAAKGQSNSSKKTSGEINIPISQRNVANQKAA